MSQPTVEDLTGGESDLLNNASDLTWRGSPMEDVYRRLSPWEFDYLPSIVNHRDHIVLYQLPWNKNATEPPSPHQSTLKWDSDHVRLPCSSRNEYKVKESDDQLLTVKSRWEIIETALLQPIVSSRSLEAAILTYNTKYKHLWKFRGLHRLFDEELDQSETTRFFSETLPAIISLALRLPELVPCAIPLLKSGSTKSISLSQQQVACLLANAFLCTFPRRNSKGHRSEYSSYPSINFSSLFAKSDDTSLQKIKCICSYFSTVCKKVPLGVITFMRRSKKPNELPDWNQNDTSFATSILHVSSSGKIEENGFGLLQVDFANKYVGGGVLGLGCVQEEIRFVICPELLVSRLFTHRMEPLECLIINGCEQFSNYSGYARTFTWEGVCNDETPFDDSGRRKCCIVAIDAINYQSRTHQYKEPMMLRDLNKAFVGFCCEGNGIAPGVATGNWGCGAFGGDKTLKTLLQLMVCCVTNRPLVYYTFDDSHLRDDFYNIFQYLSENKIKICTLWSYLKNFQQQNSSCDHLYAYIIQCHKDESCVSGPSARTMNPRLKDNTFGESSRETTLPASSKGDYYSSQQLLEDSTVHGEQNNDLFSSVVKQGRQSPPLHTLLPSDSHDITFIEPESIPSQQDIELELEKGFQKTSNTVDHVPLKPEKRSRSLLESLDDFYFDSGPTKIKKS